MTSPIVSRGRKLEYFTLVYNGLEGIVSIAAGVLAGSVSLVAFGLDSAIEMASGATLLWRLRETEARERTALRTVGWCFLALALYVSLESIAALWQRTAPEKSPVGIAIAAASVVVMPLLARAKRKVATAMNSAAMQADSRQNDLCAYLSAIVLGGLLLNAAFGWWWADPSAALAMVPIIVKEGLDGVRARACACHPGSLPLDNPHVAP